MEPNGHVQQSNEGMTTYLDFESHCTCSYDHLPFDFLTIDDCPLHARLLAPLLEDKPAIVGPVMCEDGKARPPWAATDPLTRLYYDTTWGVPGLSENEMFRALCFQVLQSGLSMRAVLRKFPALNRAFSDFDPYVVAQMTEADVEKMLDNPALIRNRTKLSAVITNAEATVAMRRDGTCLPELVWAYQPAIMPQPETMLDIPERTEESAALARDLKARGFTFIGPKSAWLFMQAAGVVNTHLQGSWRRDAGLRMTPLEF